MDNAPATRVRGLDSSLTIATSSSDNTTSNNDLTDKITIEDWSKTGRGSHVDFERHEKVPLDPVRWLGRGTMGDVHEVKIEGLNFAHKRVLHRRKIGERERREIEILKKLSHSHVVQVVGTYTHMKFLGIIMYPVAVCDLSTFFEDVEAWTDLVVQHPRSVALKSLDLSSKERLNALAYDYPTEPSEGLMAIPIFVQIGCLLSAVAYLHDGQKIRHKDLKPSNILLSRSNLCLSDFGSATDFSLLSQSATDNERGTPRYFAPEMAERKSCGRSADIFSLGCVLLEIILVQRCGTLEHARLNRSDDSCFHANLDRIDGWLRHSTQSACSARENFLNCELKRMLAANPTERPTISELMLSFSAADMATAQLDAFISIFGGCCKNLLMSRKQHESQITPLRKDLEDAESYSRDTALRYNDLLEYRKQDKALYANLQRSLNRLKENYRNLEHSKRRSKAIENRVVEEKDGEYFTRSWVESQSEVMVMNLKQLKEHFRDMEFHLMMDTTQTRIPYNAATEDAQHEVFAHETELSIYLGMESMEDALEALQVQSEQVRRSIRDRVGAQHPHAIWLRRKLRENAEDTSKERERVGVPDAELGAQETAEGHSGARELHTVVKKKSNAGFERTTLAASVIGRGIEASSTSTRGQISMASTREPSSNSIKYGKLSKDPGT